jgi:diguanylate cyclase (GGDEF)-like protein
MLPMMTDPFELLLLSFTNVTLIGLPVTAALAAVALIGYIFGRRTRSSMAAAIDERRQQELERAARIAWQLESIAGALRQDLAMHHSQLSEFKRSLRQAKENPGDGSWERLCTEAEAMLAPTMQLAHQLSHAYDQIRQQSEALETFTQGRTDPLTGVGNGRALEHQLRVLLGAAARGSTEFCIALVSLDLANSSEHGRSLSAIMPMLPKVAGVIRACMRGPDFVARYGDEEFVVVMPKTSLAGAKVFGDRLRKRVADDLSASVCCGIAQAQAGDDARSLFARADSALYSAKAAGPNHMFVHTGGHIREHAPPVRAAGTACNATQRDANPVAAPASTAMDDKSSDPADLSLLEQELAVI